MSKQIVICRETCKWEGTTYHVNKAYHSDVDGEIGYVRIKGKIKTIFGINSRMYKYVNNATSERFGPNFIGLIPRELLDENFLNYKDILEVDKLFNKLIDENEFRRIR